MWGTPRLPCRSAETLDVDVRERILSGILKLDSLSFVRLHSVAMRPSLLPVPRFSCAGCVVSKSLLLCSNPKQHHNTFAPNVLLRDLVPTKTIRDHLTGVDSAGRCNHG